jgi:hypothetical protein
VVETINRKELSMAIEPRKLITVKTYDTGLPGSEALPYRLVDLLMWTSARLAEVPKAYQNSARVHATDGGGDLFIVVYDRPETDEEYAAREGEIQAVPAQKAVSYFPDDGEPDPKAYRDPYHEGNSSRYHTGKPCGMAGCPNPAGTRWGPDWCMQHNIKVLTRRVKILDAIAINYERGYAMGLAGDPAPGTDTGDLWRGWCAGKANREIDG